MKPEQHISSAIAVGLIVAEDGRILLQHRDDKPGLVGAGQWGFFGGHVEASERPTQAFLREIEEELAWRPRHIELFTTREIEHHGGATTSYAYGAHLDVPFESLVLGEGQGMALFDPSALPPETMPGIGEVVAQFAASRTYRRLKRRYDVLTATALLVGADGRFLLQHRDDKPEIANPGKWGSFGGEIEPGETPDEGFLREMEEELAWAPSRYELYAAVDFPARGSPQLIYIYTALVDVPIEALVLGEGQGMAYFSPDALPQTIVTELRLLIESFTAGDHYAAMLARTPNS
ncbi:MAG: NUDIX domain-containing protein [Dehalococcoidia bacterium]